MIKTTATTRAAAAAAATATTTTTTTTTTNNNNNVQIEFARCEKDILLVWLMLDNMSGVSTHCPQFPLNLETLNVQMNLPESHIQFIYIHSDWSALSIHPGRLTWNLQITHLERNMIWTKPPGNYVPAVNLQGCNLDLSISAFSLIEKNPSKMNPVANCRSPSNSTNLDPGWPQVHSKFMDLTIASKCLTTGGGFK